MKRDRWSRFFPSVSVPTRVSGDAVDPAGGGTVAGEVARPTVESLMSRSFVNIPPWFSAAKAAAVLRSLGRAFALIPDPRGGIGVASIEDLSRAPEEKTAQWCATGATGFVTPLDTVADAWRTMVDMKTERLPVKVGDLIVGVVTSSALRRARKPVKQAAAAEVAAELAA